MNIPVTQEAAAEVGEVHLIHYCKEVIRNTGSTISAVRHVRDVKGIPLKDAATWVMENIVYPADAVSSESVAPSALPAGFVDLPMGEGRFATVRHEIIGSVIDHLTDPSRSCVGEIGAPAGEFYQVALPRIEVLALIARAQNP